MKFSEHFIEQCGHELFRTQTYNGSKTEVTRSVGGGLFTGLLGCEATYSNVIFQTLMYSSKHGCLRKHTSANNHQEKRPGK